MDRFEFAEFFATYRLNNASGKVNVIAVIGQEPIVHERKFGETVAINRFTNVRVFTDIVEGSKWLREQ